MAAASALPGSCPGQPRSEWVCGSRSSRSAWHFSSFPSMPGWCHQPSKSGKLCVRWVGVAPVAGGCCHQCLFWETLFPSLLCDPHRSGEKGGQPRESKRPWHRDIAQHGYRLQPRQPSEGQVKQKIRIISFICGSVVVPLRGTPNFLVE